MAHPLVRFHRNRPFSYKSRDKLCSARHERYENEMRLRSSHNSAEVLDANRPYGLSWSDQGAVEDVWWMILANITDPKEIIQMHKVSDLFRAILRRRYVQVVLPNILVICFGNYRKYFIPQPEAGQDPDYLALRVWLKFRLLSKLTKRSMEDYFHEIGDPAPKEPETEDEDPENEDSELDIENRNREAPQEPDSEETYVIPDIQFFDDENVEAFIRKIDRANIQNDGTFFPQRFLIDETDLTNPDTSIPPVLQRIGRSIRRLEYIPHPRFIRYPDHPRHRSYKTIYTALLQWLQETPNLEILDINSCLIKEPYMMPTETIAPFATCPKLRVFRDHYNFPAAFRARILQANPSIKVLAHGRCDWESVPGTGLYGDYLPRIPDLQLEEWTSLSVPPSPVLNFFCRWPLKKVDILVTGPACQPALSSKLFRFLNNFGNTLETLRIDIPLEDDGGDLNLPNLTWFGWRAQKIFPSFDFIIAFEKLTYFDVYDDEGMLAPYEDDDDEDPPSDILDFYDSAKSEDFEWSGMDDFFPRLRRVKIFRSDGSVKRFLF